MSEPIDDKMQLAVNAAWTEAQIIAARAGLMNGGVGLDQKRQGSYCEFGWPDEVSFSDMFRAYKRGGIAHGAVNKLIDKVWQTDPWIIEGKPEDNKEKETRWEAGNDNLFRDGLFWEEFKEADRRRLVGRYSGLILRIKDSKNWDQPVERSAMLVEMKPAWASTLTATDFDIDPNSDYYGQPLYWQYTEQGVAGAPGRVLKIHRDRVFILGDYSDDAIGYLEPVFNNFVNLEKIEGGSGESILKNSARQLAVNFAPEVDLTQIASAYGVDVKGLKQIFDENVKKINRGIDSMMVTQGATSVAPLVSAVPDPTPSYNTNIQSVSAGINMAQKILVGNQNGERASTEDNKEFNAHGMGVRKSRGYEIGKLIRHLMRIKVVKPLAKFTVMWDDLTESTLAEKLANGKTMAEINQASLATGAPVYTTEEIREATDYENEDPTKKPLPETPTGEVAPEGEAE